VQVTVDGGVGLAFDQLDTTTDTSEVEQLYSALNQMLELDAEEENAEVRSGGRGCCRQVGVTGGMMLGAWPAVHVCWS
jgi:hypothetical protein